MEKYITVNNVTKKFKNVAVLSDINIDFEKGKIHGLIGRNGSGKTMLMKCICGLVPVSSGNIIVNGKEIGRDIQIPESLGAIIETPGFLTGYSGYQNLLFLSRINHKINREQIRAAIIAVGLDPDERKNVGKYSLGMRQRLGLAQAIMEDPDLLLLDEPMNGLDKEGISDMRDLLLSLKEKGKTIILASHSSEDIDVLCDSVSEMEHGELNIIR